MGSVDPVALAQRLWASVPDRGLEARAVLNGLFGDHLARAESPLAISMALLEGPEHARLPDPPAAGLSLGPHACLLVHGLMGSELAWAMGTADGVRSEYGRALAEARGVTPLYVRYNTGRHVSTNGQALAARLEALVDACSDLDTLTIVAHSMGGLVVRSACHYGLLAGHRWVSRVDRVFLLGSPSHGAPLEQLVHVAAFTLDAVWNPWTKIIGKVLNLRSEGIKDLRHGYVTDEDWRNRDPDVLALRRPRPAQVPPQVRWYVVAATLGPRNGRLSWLLGDGLVRPSSAQGRGFGTPDPGLLPHAEQRVFEQTSHMALMTDPRVLEQLLAWWPTPGPPL